MGRPKGSKNKNIVEPKSSKKEVKRANIASHQKDEKAELVIKVHDYEDFSSKILRKGGAICVSFKNLEFSFVTDPFNGELTLRYDLNGISDFTNKTHKDFKFTLTPQLMYNFLNYIKEVPVDQLEKKLIKIRTYLKKTEQL